MDLPQLGKLLRSVAVSPTSPLLFELKNHFFLLILNVLLFMLAAEE